MRGDWRDGEPLTPLPSRRGRGGRSGSLGKEGRRARQRPSQEGGATSAAAAVAARVRMCGGQTGAGGMVRWCTPSFEYRYALRSFRWAIKN
jgi:hypothetical protein